MEKELKSLYQLSLVFLMAASLCFSVNGQGKLDISAGLGIPEMTNIGLRYQLSPFQVGGSIGLLPISETTIFTLSGDIFYHFAGNTSWSDRRPLYGRVGIVFMDDKGDDYHDRYVFLNTRIGWEFNFNERSGLALGGGVIFELHQEEVIRDSDTWDFDFPVLPSLGLTYFYKL